MKCSFCEKEFDDVCLGKAHEKFEHMTNQFADASKEVIVLWEPMTEQRIAFQHTPEENMSDQPSVQSMFFDILSKQSERIEQLEANQKFIYEALQALASGMPLPNLKEELKERSK